MEECQTVTIGGIAFTDYIKNGVTIKTLKVQKTYAGYKEVWYVNGKKHNDAGWAKLVYYRGLTSMFWYRHGKLHNENGPAVVRVMEFTGSLFGPHTVIIERGWYKHGQLGSDIEPALIQRANMDLDYYFIEDDTYLIDEFRTRVKGPVVRAAMRPLPIPVADVIWHHYCYQ